MQSQEPARTELFKVIFQEASPAIQGQESKSYFTKVKNMLQEVERNENQIRKMQAMYQ